MPALPTLPFYLIVLKYNYVIAAGVVRSHIAIIRLYAEEGCAEIV